MKRAKTTRLQKAALVFLSIAISLAMIELGFGGIVLEMAQRNALTGHAAGADEVYTILAIGESTTAGTMNSWPAQLEKILNNNTKKIRFKVYNAGIPDASIVLLAGKLEENIMKYNPDMVISMMGATQKKEEFMFIREKEPFLDLKIIKAARLVLDSLKREELMDATAKPGNLATAASADSRALADKGRGYMENSRIVEAEAALKKAIVSDPSNHLAYEWLGLLYFSSGRTEESISMYKKSIEIFPTKDSYVGLGAAYYSLKDYVAAEPMFRQAIRLKQDDDNAYLHLGWIYRETGRLGEAKSMFGKAFQINPENYAAGISLSYLNNDSPAQAIESYFSISVEPAQNLSSYEIAKYHYRKAYEILRDSNIRYAAMQYPSLDVDIIKSFFDEEERKDIIFISNSENFREAIAKGEYGDYFIDDAGMQREDGFIFKGNFGHATPAGNLLIAKSAAIAVGSLNLS